MEELEKVRPISENAQFSNSVESNFSGILRNSPSNGNILIRENRNNIGRFVFFIQNRLNILISLNYMHFNLFDLQKLIYQCLIKNCSNCL